MAAVDGMVTEHLIDRLVNPERLTELLEAYIARSSDAEARDQIQLGKARQRTTELRGKINRLLQMVADGLMEHDDPQLKDMLLGLEAQRAEAEETVSLLETSRRTTAGGMTPERIERCGYLLRTALEGGDVAFRKAYLRLFVDQVVVGDTEIRICGPKASLAKMALQGSLPPPAAMVPSFVREWRPVRDSNPCYQRERLTSSIARNSERRKISQYIAYLRPTVSLDISVRIWETYGR